MDVRHTNRVWNNLKNTPQPNVPYGRIFCVKCGRPASGDGESYQCNAGHWMKVKGPKTHTIDNIPSSWKDAKVKDPKIKFDVPDSGVFCLKCSRAMYITNNMCYEDKFYQIVYSCKCGYTMDLSTD